MLDVEKEELIVIDIFIVLYLEIVVGSEVISGSEVVVFKELGVLVVDVELVDENDVVGV